LLFFALLLGILALIMISSIPSAKKEILSEKQAENTVNSPISNSEVDDASGDTDNNQEKNSPTKEILPENTKNNTSETKESPKNIKIIQKLVSWGFSKSSAPRIINTIIIHSSYDALGGDPYDVSALIKEYKSYGVAPHYLIDRSGNIYQLVKDNNIAYHAGESKMPDGRTGVNNFSLGIEIMTTEKDSPTEAQYQSLSNLIGYIKKDYKIGDVLGHNQIAPGRKTDPWNFNWNKI
jgi:N-acetyl-anhydromuramyl-L-alanine amidase AmpD